MKKTLIAAITVTVTLIVPGADAVFAEEPPLEGGRPPCSMMERSPLKDNVRPMLCKSPVPID